MRRRIVQSISRAWWSGLGAVGLPRTRWDALPSARRRAVKAGLWVAAFLVLVALFGVWKTSALAVGAVIFLILAPEWSRLAIRGWRVGRWFAPSP